MRRLLFMLLMPSLAFAQGAYYGNNAFSNKYINGTHVVSVFDGATVEICTTVTGTCTQAPVFSDAALSLPLTQPLSVDDGGNFGFFITPGTYAYWILDSDGLPVLQIPFTTGGSNATGVASLNTITGAVNITAGSNITVTPSGSNISIAASIPSYTSPLTNQVATYLSRANTSTTSNGPSIISDDGATATVHGALSATSMQISTGGTLSGNQGTGFMVQHSIGTTTTDNCAKFDSSGNTVDSGGPCSSSYSPSTHIVTSGRTEAFTYQNANPGPMFVAFSGTTGSTGSIWANVGTSSSAVSAGGAGVQVQNCSTAFGQCVLSFMVPAGSYYRVQSDVSSAIQIWTEWY